MLLKSEKKIIEQIKNLSDREIYRAYHKAVMEGDFELCFKITQCLSPEKRAVLESNHRLFFCKFIALQMLLLSKASLAISFYNALLSRFLGKDYPKELYGKHFAEERLKEMRFFQEKIKQLDIKTYGALELEGDSFTGGIENDFDYWVDIGEKLLEKLKAILLGSKLNQKGLEHSPNNS